MFLTADEIVRLTGFKRASRQTLWLKEKDWEFRLNGLLHPIIEIAEVNRKLVGKDEPPDPRQRVYLIPAGRMVKVGVARDVANRWRGLRCGNPAIRPVAYESRPLDRATWVESQVHRELAAFRVRGEWFKCRIAVAIAAIKRWEALATT